MPTLATDTAHNDATRLIPQAQTTRVPRDGFTAQLTCHPDGTVTLTCRGVTGEGPTADTALRDLKLKLREAEADVFET